MADWVILMCRAFWKCLLSTSRMARAKPHKKKSDVMRMNGTRYFLSLTEWFSVSWFNIFLFYFFFTEHFFILDAGSAGSLFLRMQDSSLLLLAIHQDSERTVEAYMAHILRLFYGWHRIEHLLVYEASLFGIGIYREIAHAE